jgi:glycosyltransferase involved in cell wall biosynthesis
MRGQINYVKSRGFTVMAAASPGSELDDVAKRDGIDVFPIPFQREPSPVKDMVSLALLARLFLQLKPHIVHSSTSKAGPLAVVAAWLARVPIRIYTLRGVMIDRRTGLMRIILKSLEWLACRCAVQVISVSPSVSEVMIAERLCRPEKIKVLAKGSSNGVDAEHRFNPALLDRTHAREVRDKLHITNGVPVIGFIGRLVSGKGIADLASAWLLIREQCKEAVLLIVGPEEKQAPVDSETMVLFRNDPRVRMPGFVKNEDLPLYYDMIDVVVFPTESEGFPNVPLEAAAMEIPVVATKVTGCVDAVVEGSTGTLVEPGSISEMVEAVIRYLRDPALCVRHGQSARERVLRDFQPQFIWNALFEEYVRLLKQSGILSEELQSGYEPASTANEH